jgi:outer membrane immunogenic protein
MKSFLRIAAAFAALSAAPAMAADMARPVYKAAPAPLPVVSYFTWTGCYVGINGGGYWADSDWNDPILGQNWGSHNVSGGLYGVQGGCDYQRGHWVLGVQGEYDWLRGSSSHANPLFPLLTHQSSHKSLATLTLRTGYAWDRFFGYVKGGGAWLESDLSLSFGGIVATSNRSRDGWTVGIGGEYAFLNWLTAFVEYDYYSGFRTEGNGFICPGCISARIKTDINVVKAGLNFRFGPGSSY